MIQQQIEHQIDMCTVQLDEMDRAAEPQWQRTARKATPYMNERGSWLVFCDRNGLGEALVTQLREQGENCLQISPGRSFQALRGEGWYWLNPAHSHDFRRLFQELHACEHPPCRGVVYCWALDDLLLEGMCVRHAECAQTLGLTALMNLIQGVARSGWCEIPKLWVVTRGTQHIDTTPLSGQLSVPLSAPLSAPLSIPGEDGCFSLWEMAEAFSDGPRTKLWGGLIDLDPACPDDEAALLFDEIWHSDGEDDQIAFRHRERYARL